MTMEMFNYGNFIKKIVEKAYLEMTRKYNLTNNEIAVVSYLSISEKDTASDIVNELLFSKSHVSLSVDSLVKKGLIEKVQDQQDKKISHLLLTEKADPMINDLFLRKKEIEEIFFKGFTREEKTQFQMLIEKMVSNITEMLPKQGGGSDGIRKS